MLSILAITQVTQQFKGKYIKQIAAILIVGITLVSRLGFCATFEEFHHESDLDLKSNHALELWNYYLSNNIDSLKIIGTELLHDASEADHTYGVNVAFRIIGDYQIWSGNHDEGVRHLQRAARYFASRGDYALYSECLTSVGNSLFLRGDLGDAEKAYKVANEAGSVSGDPTAWFAAELNLSKVMAAKGDTVKAIELAKHFKEESIRLNKYEAVSNAYGYLSQLTSDSETALQSEYLLKGVRYARMSGAVNQLSHAWNNMAIHHFYNGLKDSAQVYFFRALEIRKQSNNARLITESYLNLASYFMLVDQEQQAGLYADSSLKLALSNNLNADAFDALEFKCNELGDYEMCIQMDSIRLVIDELQSKDDKILESIIAIYSSEKLENESNENRTWKVVLIPLILLVLGIAIYRN